MRNNLTVGKFIANYRAQSKAVKQLLLGGLITDVLAELGKNPPICVIAIMIIAADSVGIKTMLTGEDRIGMS